MELHEVLILTTIEMLNFLLAYIVVFGAKLRREKGYNSNIYSRINIAGGSIYVYRTRDKFYNYNVLLVCIACMLV